MARIRDKQTGDKIGTKNQTTIHTNDLIVSRIDARNGATTIVPSELVSGLFRTRSGSATVAPTLIFWEGTVHPRPWHPLRHLGHRIHQTAGEGAPARSCPRGRQLMKDAGARWRRSWIGGAKAVRSSRVKSPADTTTPGGRPGIPAALRQVGESDRLGPAVPSSSHFLTSTKARLNPTITH